MQHANKSERSEFSGRMLAADETMLKKETFSQPQKASFVQRVKSESSDPPRPVGGRSQPVNRLSRLQHTNNIKRENTCQTSLKTERRIDSAGGVFIYTVHIDIIETVYFLGLFHVDQTKI